MTFTTRSSSFTPFGSKAISPRHVLMSIALMLTLLLVGCFDQEVTDRLNAEAAQICKGVTADNWGQPYGACVDKASYNFVPMSKEYPVRACLLGGLSRFCQNRGNEFLVWSWTGRPVIFDQKYADRVRQEARYFYIESRDVSVAILLDPEEGRDLWYNHDTVQLDRSTFQKTSADHVGFVGVRSPGMPTGWRVTDVGSEGVAYDVVIEFSYPEANVKVTIDDPHDDHCIGYTRVDEAGVIVVINSGHCRPAITRLTYDYADPPLVPTF